jgi:hypothetical protein
MFPEQVVITPSHETPNFAPIDSIYSASPSHVRMIK